MSFILCFKTTAIYAFFFPLSLSIISSSYLRDDTSYLSVHFAGFFAAGAFTLVGLAIEEDTEAAAEAEVVVEEEEGKAEEEEIAMDGSTKLLLTLEEAISATTPPPLAAALTTATESAGLYTVGLARMALSSAMPEYGRFV